MKVDHSNEDESLENAVRKDETLNSDDDSLKTSVECNAFKTYHIFSLGLRTSDETLCIDMYFIWEYIRWENGYLVLEYTKK